MSFHLLDPSVVKLVHVNLRTEKHGEEDVPVLDLKLEHTTTNVILDQFADGLLPALYRKKPRDEKQLPMEGIEPAYPTLRFAGMGTIPWDLRLEGARVVLEYGVNDDVDLGGCGVDKFRLDCLDGGSVRISFRVQALRIPPGTLDKLTALLSGEAKARVMPATE